MVLTPDLDAILKDLPEHLAPKDDGFDGCARNASKNRQVFLKNGDLFLLAPEGRPVPWVFEMCFDQ